MPRDQKNPILRQRFARRFRHPHTFEHDRFKLTRSCSFFYRRRARFHKRVIALAQAARNHQRIAGDPTRLLRRQEHRDRRYIVRLSGPAGVPASSSVAVHCSASGAFSTTTANGICARATGTVNQIAVNTNAANTNAVTLTCMWEQP
jgi:hypothetical protein